MGNAINKVWVFVMTLIPTHFIVVSLSLGFDFVRDENMRCGGSDGVMCGFLLYLWNISPFGHARIRFFF